MDVGKGPGSASERQEWLGGWRVCGCCQSVVWGQMAPLGLSLGVPGLGVPGSGPEGLL